MKKTLLIAVVFIFSMPFTGWGQSENRNVGKFTAISMGVAGDLYITQGNRVEVVVEGDQDDLDDLITEVRNGTLEIRFERGGWNFSRDRITIQVTTPQIEGISLGGSGKVISENTLETDRLDLSVSGSGRMELQINTDELQSSISGSGNMSLSGRADEVRLTISGSGNLDAEELDTDSYEVQISGSGRSRINVGKQLEARISGSGSVFYTGDPDKVISNVSGSGRVKKL
jgi:acylphosphatase